MSRDKYSDNHTIELFRDRNFSIETESHFGGGSISLKTKGDDGHIYLETGEAGESGGTIYIRNLGDDGEVRIGSDSAGVSITSGVALGLYQGESGYGRLTIRAKGSLGMLLDTTVGDMSFDCQQGNVDFDCLSGNMSFDCLTGDTAFNNVSGDITLNSQNITIDSSGSCLIEGETVGISSNMTLEIASVNGDLNMGADNDLSIGAKGAVLLTATGTEDLTIRPAPVADAVVDGRLKVTSDTYCLDDLYVDSIYSTMHKPFILRARLNGAPNYSPPDWTNNNNFAMYLDNRRGQVGGSNGIAIDLCPPAFFGSPGTPNNSNNWMRFLWNRDWKGAIQAADDIGLPPPLDGLGYYGGNGDGGSILNVVGSITPALPLLTSPGNAQYVSGNADFGEYFEAGDLDEWGLEPERGRLGLAEGIVVWVIDNKFYRAPKDGVGVPMLVTRRALVVGSHRPPESDSFGEVLSFIGKLPVIIKGSAKVGDLILPDKDENLCYALPKDEATLQDYMRALGTTLESCPESSILPDDDENNPGEKAFRHRVWCAIGVK
jgi:hypothetical protein